MLVAVVHPLSVFAANSFVPTSLSGISFGGSGTDIGTFISGVLNLLVIIAGLIALVFLIIGGIRYITSGGDSSKTEAARKQIIAALIGLVIVLVSFLFLNVVLGLLGLGSVNQIITCPNGGTMQPNGVCP